MLLSEPGADEMEEGGSASSEVSGNFRCYRFVVPNGIGMII